MGLLDLNLAHLPLKADLLVKVLELLFGHVLLLEGLGSINSPLRAQGLVLSDASNSEVVPLLEPFVEELFLLSKFGLVQLVLLCLLSLLDGQ